MMQQRMPRRFALDTRSNLSLEVHGRFVEQRCARDLILRTQIVLQRERPEPLRANSEGKTRTCPMRRRAGGHSLELGAMARAGSTDRANVHEGQGAI